MPTKVATHNKVKGLTRIVFVIEANKKRYEVVYEARSNCTDVYDKSPRTFNKATDWFCRMPATRCESAIMALLILQKALKK